jgi:hypothetical protein
MFETFERSQSLPFICSFASHITLVKRCIPFLGCTNKNAASQHHLAMQWQRISCPKCFQGLHGLQTAQISRTKHPAQIQEFWQVPAGSDARLRKRLPIPL